MAKQIIIFFLYLFACVIISYLIKKKNELVARKILHILVFGLWIIYIYLLDYITGIILAIIVNIGLLLLTIKEKRYGEITYGLILLAFIIDRNNEQINTIRLAVISFADGFAPITAQIFKDINKPITKLNDKTYIGSLTFFAISLFVLTFACNIYLSILYAAILTFVEYVSKNDNLTLYLFLVILL